MMNDAKKEIKTFFLLQMYMYNKNFAITLYIEIHMYIK